MATIAKLVLRIEADTRTVQNQLRDASRAVNKFTSDLNRSFSKLPNFDKMVVGGAPLKSKLDSIERDFDRTFASLRNKAKREVISPTAFADQLRTAVQNAKNETQATIGRLQQAGDITGRQARGLIARSEREAIKAETSILIGEAQHSLSTLENQFRATQATLTQRRQAGLGEREFRALGKKAESEFNAGWEAEMARFAKDPRFTEPMRQAFARQFKGGGFGFDAAQIPIAKSIDAAKAQAGAYIQTYQKTIQNAKFENLTGNLTGKQFSKALADANKELGVGLRKVRDQLEKDGLLTPEAMQFLNRQFQRGGETAATGFFEAFDKAMASSSIASLQRIGTLATQVGTSLTKFLTLPLAGAGVGIIKLAGDAQQAESRLQQVFGVRSVEFGRQLDALRLKIPATSSELRTMAARLGELFIPLGLAPAKIEEMSIKMVEAAKNISIFSGVSTERAFGALINGLVGQSRELKKLGIEIDDRTIRDEAYRQGIARVGAQLSTTQKVVAGYSVILQRTGLIANSVAAQQNTFNVQLLFMTARLKEAGIALGTVLLPTLTKVVSGLASLAESFAELSAPVKATIVIIGGIAAALGPGLLALGLFIRSITFVQSALLALGELTGIEGGIAAILGVTAVGIGLIVTATGAIIALAAAWDEYTDSLGDFKGLSRATRQEMEGMTKEQLRNVLVIQKANQDRIKAETETLRKQAGIEVTHIPLPGGFSGPEILRGGNVQQRQQFIALQEDAKRVAATWEFANNQLEKTIDLENQLGGREKELQERIKKTQDAAHGQLLKEQLDAAKAAMQDLNRTVADVKKNLSAGIKLKDADLVTRSIEQARDAISSLEAEAKTLHAQSILPDNGNIREKLQGLERSAVASANSLKAFLTTVEKDKSLNDFAARLAEIKALLAAGFATDNIEAISKAFGNIASLSEELTKAMEEASARGDTAGAARFNSMIQSLTALKAKAENSLLIPKEFFNQIDIAIAKLNLLKEAAPEGVVTSTGIRVEDMDKAAELSRQLSTQLVELASEYVALRVEAERTGKDLSGLMEDNLRKQREVTRALNEFRPNKFEQMFPDMLPELQQLGAAIRVVADEEQNALAAGDTQGAERAHLRRLEQLGDLGRLRQSLIDTMKTMGLSDAVQQQVLAGFAKDFKLAGGEAGDFAEKVSRGEKRLIRMGQLVAVVRQLAEAFGDVNGNVGKALTSFGTLITSVDTLRKANAAFEKRRKEEGASQGVDPNTIQRNFGETVAQISSIIGIVASTVNIFKSIASLFGGRREIEREHNRILVENNQKLAEMKLALDGFSGSIGDQLKVANALRSGAVEPILRGSSGGTGGTLDETRINAINLRLKEFGISWEQVVKVAKDNGIQLLDSKSRIVVGAFQQIIDAIDLARKAMLTYTTSLQDITAKTDLFNNVFNVPDTGQQQVTDSLSALSQLAPKFFQQFFGGVDLSDMSAVEAALQAFTKALLDGTLEADESFKFLSRSELEQVLNGTASGLDKLREATDSLTDSMLNVPTWFKRAQTVFESVDVQQPKPPDTAGVPTPGSQGPFTPSVPNPPNIKSQRMESRSIDTDNMAVADIKAAVLKVASGTLSTRTTDTQDMTVAGMTAAFLNIGTLTVANAPALDVKVPDSAKLTVTTGPIAPVQANVNIPPIDPIPVKLVAPTEIPAVTVKLPDEPVKLEAPPVPKVVAQVQVPDIPPVKVDVPTEPIKLSLPDIPPVTADLRVPRLDPLPVRLADQTVTVAVAPLPTLQATATVADLPPVAIKLPDEPVRLALPDIKPIPVALDVPTIAPIPVTIAQNSVTVSVAPLPTVTANVVLPKIPPVQLTAPAEPVQLAVPDIPDIVARVVVPPLPAVQLAAPNEPVKLDLPEIPPVTADFRLPEIPPIPVRLADQSLTVSVAPLPVLQATATVPSLPPVTLRVPADPVAIDLPAIPPIKAQVDIPPVDPVQLTLPEKPVRLSLPDIPPLTATVSVSELDPVPVDLRLPTLPPIELAAPREPVRLSLPDVPPVQLTLPSGPVTVDVADLPAITANVVVPPIPPVQVAVPTTPVKLALPEIPAITADLKVPPLDPLPVRLADQTVTVAVAPLPTLQATATVPSLPPVTLRLPSDPVQVQLPPIPPVVAQVVVPPIDPVRLTLPDEPVKLTLPDVPPLNATVTLAKLDAVPVDLRLPDVPPVELTLPRDPVRLQLPDVPPVQLKAPLDPVKLDVPKIPDVLARVEVPQVPPVQLATPREPVKLTLPMIPTIEADLKVPRLEPIPVQLADQTLTVTVAPLPVLQAQASVPDLAPVTLRLPTDPVQLELPKIPPVPVDLAVPPIGPVPVTLANNAVTVTVAPLAPVTANVVLPDVLPVELADIPPVKLVAPDIPPITAQVVVRDIPPVRLSLPTTPVDVRVADIPNVTVQANVAPIPPVPVRVSNQSVAVSVAPIPPVTARLQLPEIPPVRLTAPTEPVTLAVPEIPPVVARVDVPNIPPVTLRVPTDPVVLRLPEIKPIDVTLSVPAVGPIPVTLANNAVTATVAPLPPVRANVIVPDIPPVQLTAPSDPVLLSLPNIPDIVARVTVPQIPPVTLKVPTTPVDVQLAAVPSVTVTVPPIPPVTVRVANQTIPVETAPIPPVTANVIVPDIPPIRLSAPSTPVQLAVPEIPDVVARVTVPVIPPVQLVAPAERVKLDLPQIPPITATVAPIDPIPVRVSTQAIPVNVAAIPPVTARLDLPEIPPVQLRAPLDPVEVDVPAIPDVVAKVDLPTIPDVVLRPPVEPVPVKLPELPSLEAKLDIPKLDPITVALADQTLQLSVPPLPAVRTNVILPEIPPVRLSLPVDPVTLRLPEIPPLDVVTRPVDPVPVDLRLPEIPTITLNPPLDPVDVQLANVPAFLDRAPAPVPADQERPLPTTDREPQFVGGGTTVQVAGPLIGAVHQQPGESTKEFARRMVAELRRQMFFRTGSSSLPGIDD